MGQAMDARNKHHQLLHNVFVSELDCIREEFMIFAEIKSHNDAAYLSQM